MKRIEPHGQDLRGGIIVTIFLRKNPLDFYLFYFLKDFMDIPSPDKHFSGQQMESLRQAFIIFDRDRDGHINKQELAMVGGCLPMVIPKKIELLFRAKVYQPCCVSL